MMVYYGITVVTSNCFMIPLCQTYVRKYLSLMLTPPGRSKYTWYPDTVGAGHKVSDSSVSGKVDISDAWQQVGRCPNCIYEYISIRHIFTCKCTYPFYCRTL